jgi:hypothetical protein
MQSCLDPAEFIARQLSILPIMFLDVNIMALIVFSRSCAAIFVCGLDVCSAEQTNNVDR